MNYYLGLIMLAAVTFAIGCKKDVPIHQEVAVVQGKLYLDCSMAPYADRTVVIQETISGFADAVIAWTDSVRTDASGHFHYRRTYKADGFTQGSISIALPEFASPIPWHINFRTVHTDLIVNDTMHAVIKLDLPPYTANDTLFVKLYNTDWFYAVGPFSPDQTMMSIDVPRGKLTFSNGVDSYLSASYYVSSDANGVGAIYKHVPCTHSEEVVLNGYSF